MFCLQEVCELQLTWFETVLPGWPTPVCFDCKVVLSIILVKEVSETFFSVFQFLPKPCAFAPGEKMPLDKGKKMFHCDALSTVCCCILFVCESF